MPVNYDVLHNAMIASANAIREELQQIETISHFDFRIKVSGRVHEGDLNMHYEIEDYPLKVKGNDLHSAVQEFKRRQGWTERNAPLQIGYDGATQNDDSEDESVADAAE